MDLLSAVATLSAVLGVTKGAPPCAPDECLRRINAIASSREVPLTDSHLPGEYAGGDGLLSGRRLYVFADHTYVYSEWADVMPETVFDKGTWSVGDRLLVFRPDADVTWRKRGRFDHRHMAIQLQSGASDLILVGVDEQLAFAESARESDGSPEAFLRFISFRRKRSWDPGEESARKAQLMKDCWHPDYFKE